MKNLTVEQVDGGKVRIGKVLTEEDKAKLMNSSSVYRPIKPGVINTAAENAAIRNALGDPRHNKWAIAAMSDEELAAWGIKRKQTAKLASAVRKNHNGKIRRKLPTQKES